MPIANCIVSPECNAGSDDLVELWSIRSGIAKDHMTINLIQGLDQFGKPYKVMAQLYLPSLWESSDISQLQLGLANALSAYFRLPLAQVLVITKIVNSGFVVEAGEELKW